MMIDGGLLREYSYTDSIREDIMILQALSSMMTILLVIVLGYCLQARGWFDEQFAKSITALITQVALPASIFISVLHFLKKEMFSELAISLGELLFVIALGYLVAYVAVRVFAVPVGRRGIMMNTFVNANTVFMGLPLNIALFGEQAMPYFLVYYLVNTLSTFTIGTYLIASDDPTAAHQQHKIDWRKVISPPLIAFIVAIIVLIVEVPIPTFLRNTLTYVGNLVTPLSLMYIGMNLQKSGLHTIRLDKDTMIVLVGRFFMIPLMVFLMLKLSGEFSGPVDVWMQRTFLVQSTVPTLVIMPILAAEAHGDVDFATNVVTITTVLFIIVLPVILFILP